MDIFSIVGDETAYKLTKKNFDEVTHKRDPYYKFNSKSQYALCPECHNPVIVINLNGAYFEEAKTGRQCIHARHYTGSIPGLATYNQHNYNNCNLKCATAEHLKSLRDDDEYNNKILQIAETNKNEIIREIDEITGINFSIKSTGNFLFESAVKSKFNIYYKATKWNIPYVILVTQPAISIYGQHIRIQSESGQKLKEKISKKSLYFKVDENNRIVKDVTFYAEITLRVENMERTNVGEKADLIVEENTQWKFNSLMRKKIVFKTIVFHE